MIAKRIHRQALVLFVPTAILFVALTLQYPLRTTFPIGGDAVRYAQRAHEVTNDPIRIFTNSHYPATITLLAVGSVFPGNWAQHLTWWMVIAQLCAGFSLAWLAFQLGRWPAANTTLLFWSLTLVGPTRFIEDGTLAQLLSLTPLLISMVFVKKQRYVIAASIAALSFFFHPATGFMALLAGVAAAPLIAFHPDRPLRRATHLLVLMLMALIFGLFFMYNFNIFNLSLESDWSDIYLTDLLRSRFGPFLLLAPMGLFLVTRTYRRQPVLVALLLTFVLSSTLLYFNDYLGPEIYAKRFAGYFMISVGLLAAIAMTHIGSTLRLPRALLIPILLLISLGLATDSWQEGDFVFNFYETPHKYARLHPDELNAIYWIRDNLPPNALVAATSVNRNSEWIPLLADVPYQKVTSLDKIPEDAPTAEYVAIFLHRESMPALNSPPLYVNDGAVVLNREALDI